MVVPSRISKIVGSSLAGLLVLITLLFNFDWNSTRSWINQYVSDVTGRRFTIRGDLTVTWKKPDPPCTNWTRWIPWPHISAADIVLGNPDWAPANTDMVTIKQLDVTLNPWPLLQHKIILPSLSIDTPKLFFLRDKEARNNWTFKSNSVSKWEVHPGKLVIRKGSVQLDDAIRHIDATAEIATLDPDKEKVYGIGWHIKGSFNETGIHGAGKAGGVLSLQNDHRPYPLEADMRIGKTHIAVKGTLTKPQNLTVLDLRLNLSGDSMAHLFSLTGVLLPETPPFSTAGHLISKLAPGQSDWTYEKFNGKVGSSNISGTLEYQLKQPRPLLKGEIVSSLLQFEDLAPLIGVEERQSSNRMLPTGEFNTGNWNALDAEIKLTAHAIAKKKNLPITDIHAELQLNDQILSLALLNLGIAGGKLSSTIRLDGRAPEMKSELQLSARHLRIQQLLPGFDRIQIGFGEINGDAALSAAGNSLAAMLASSNGEFKALVNQGAISQLLLEELGLNPGDVMMSRLFGDRPVNLNCLTSNFTVSNGLMLARTFALDTEDALINITGNINLAQEQLHLTIDPRSKDLRTISLRSPLSVSGPFNHPNISVDKRAALQAGSAVLLGVAAPVTAILPLINVNTKQKIDCAGLLEEAQKRPTAG
jgi:uncharacterized protein involved in outer membrane biogenesis